MGKCRECDHVFNVLAYLSLKRRDAAFKKGLGNVVVVVAAAAV